MGKSILNDMEQIPKMDDFMKEIFKERTKFNELQVESITDKILTKSRDCGP